MRYEDTVNMVCGHDWRTVNKEERDGGYGVGIMMAFLRGCRPSVSEMANHLNVNIDEIISAFTRLARAGAFQKKWNARKDPWLLGQSENPWEHEVAWCSIAGISSGFIGV